MRPSQTRLIRGIRLALAPFAGPERSGEDRRRVAAIENALNELALQNDLDFMSTRRTQADALEQEAATLGAAPEPALNGEAPLDRLARSLESAVAALAPREKTDDAVKDLLARIVDWENALHARRLQPPPKTDAGDLRGPRFTAETIASYLRVKFPEWRDLRVSEVRQLAGGFSKATVLFEVEDAVNGCRPLVIRAEQPESLLLLEGTRIHNEYHVLKLAYANGTPVAEPLWLEEDTGAFGTPFLVSRRAPGRNFGSRVDVRETISETLLRDILRRLVEIHATPVDPAAANVAASHLGRWARFATLQECVAAQIAFWRERSRNFGLGAAPILTRALAWLAQNVPPNGDRPALLHGDYGLHNLLIGDDDTVSCILDWEGTTLGDPADELVWLSGGLRGSATREQVVALYHELGGRKISAARLHYFDVMNSVRFAVTCARALYLFEAHEDASIDMLDLGLLYMFHGTGTLNHSIELAEAAAREGR